MEMKLTIREDSANYACTVVKLPVKQKVEGLDKLVKVTVFGNDVLTQKDSDESQLYLFFPAECAISQEYLSLNNEFRETTLNADKSKSGYFEPTGRVKAVKFKGVISTGYLAPLDTLEEWYDPKKFKEGDEFTTIEGWDLCKKYKIQHMQSAGNGKESKYNKKLKKFSKLVHNQFRFHVDTSQLAKNLHVFHPEDIIVITDKWHGTSAVFSNVLVNKKLSWKEKLAKKLGIDVITTKYDNLYSSRSVIKNEHINENIQTNALGGYYNEDIWGTVNKELEGKIEQGISLYGEIVGYLSSGKHIQKGYDYGCDSKTYEFDGIRVYPQHKFLVYRITYTKPDGNVIEFSWNQIKEYCKKYSLEHVKELYFGLLKELPSLKWYGAEDKDTLLKGLCLDYLEKDCKYCINKVPAEGVVVRRDGLDSYSAYKLKSKRFLEKESKQLDEEAKEGTANIEDDA